MDWTVFVICFTSVIVLLIIYLIVKENKKHRKEGERTETTAKVDWKNGSFEIGNKTSDNLQKQNQIVEKSFNTQSELEKLEGKSNKQILEYYKKKDYNDTITRLVVYIEYSKIISRTIIDVFGLVISYIAKNHILSKDKNEFNTYVKEKKIIIISMFDTALSKSSIESIQKLSIDKVCNFYYIIVLDNIKDMYDSVYENHLLQADKRKKFLSNLKNIEAKNRFKSYDDFIRNNYTETATKDAEIVKEHTEYLLNLLLGLFHDMIEKNMGGGYELPR